MGVMLLSNIHRANHLLLLRFSRKDVFIKICKRYLFNGLIEPTQNSSAS
jgi:hypothetical protein